jgi:hypothetical protein
MSDQIDVLDFSTLRPIELPVKIPDEQDGYKDYILRAACADSVIQYRSTITSAAKLAANGKLGGVDGRLVGAEPTIVSRNLFRVDKNGRAKNPVGEQFIRNLPYEILDKLFERLKDITPGMVSKDTVESLTKQVEKLNERIAILREKGDPIKNS